MHGPARSQIGFDLFNRLILPLGQIVGKQSPDAGVDFRCDLNQGGIINAGPESPAHRQCQLKFQQIIIDDSMHARLIFVHGPGLMHLDDGLA